MDNQDIIKKLESLRQLDFDAVQAYSQAIEKIDVMSIRTELERFRGDHERHITDLATAIQRLGGQPEELGRDVKGVLIEGMTMLRSVTGTKGALKAMKTNEKLTNKSYEEALESDLPIDVQDVVLRNRQDEARHLEFIEAALDQLDDVEDEITASPPPR